MGLCPSRNVERERDDEEIPRVVRPVEITPQDRSTVAVSPSSSSLTTNSTAPSNEEEFSDIPPLVQNILEELQTDSHTAAEFEVTSTANDQTATNDGDNDSTTSEVEVPSNAQVLLLVLPPRPTEPDRPRLLLVVIGGGPNPLPAMNEEAQFQNLLNQLFQSAQPKTHPTSPKAIKCLPSTVMSEQLLAKSPKCVICCEEFQVGQNVIKMPCEHVFERECVEPWLKTNNTCPVCRYELPVEDEEYEKERREKMKQSRGEINEVDFFGEDGKSEM